MNKQTKVTAFVRKVDQVKYVKQDFFWAGIRKDDFRQTQNKTGRFLEHAHWATGEPSLGLTCVVAFLDNQDLTRWRTANCSESKNVLCIRDSPVLPTSMFQTENVSVASELNATHNSATNTGGHRAGFIVFGILFFIALLSILALLFYIYKKNLALRSCQASPHGKDAEEFLLDKAKARVSENESSALVNGDSGCRIIVIGPQLSQDYLKKHGIEFSPIELNSTSCPEQIDFQLTNTLVHYIEKYLKRNQPFSRKIHLINIIIQGSDMEDERTWRKALKAAKKESGHIVYIPTTEGRSIPISNGLVCTSSELAASAVLITDAVYNCDTKHIPFPACTAMTVGCKVDDHVKTMAWGGLLDFNVSHDDQRSVPYSGRNILVEDCNRPGAIATAAVAGVLEAAAPPGYRCPTGRMRQLLIGLCQKQDDQSHDILNRFGEIRPDEILKAPEEIKDKYNELNKTYVEEQGSSSTTQGQIWLRGKEIEDEKVKFLKDLSEMDFNTDIAVKIGIIGGGIDRDNDLIENIHLEDSKDFTEETNPAKDFKDFTTSPTAVLWRMFQDHTKRENSPLNRRNVKFYHAKFSDSENEYQKSSYYNALKWLVNKDVDIIVQFYYMHHLPHPWDGMSVLQEAISKKVFITAAYFNYGKSIQLFPSTVAISVGGKHPEGILHDYSAVGGFLDFIAPLCLESERERPKSPKNYLYNAASYTTAVTAYILLLSKIKGIDDGDYKRLCSTDTMRSVLIKMCRSREQSSPERSAQEGHGLLCPWAHLLDWDNILHPLITKYIDIAAPNSYWTGKDM